MGGGSRTSFSAAGARGRGLLLCVGPPERDDAFDGGRLG